MLRRLNGLLVVILLIGVTVQGLGSARAEEIRIAGGYGLCYLPIDIALDQKLIEKHAAAAGIQNVQVSLQRLASGNTDTDAILSGSADVAMVGASVMLNIIDKTVAHNPIKGIMAMCDSPVYFNTTDPRLQSIRDFEPTDRIAMAGGPGTQHALILEMAAAKAFGWDQRDKLDDLLVAMPHPDGVAALLSGVIKTHATTVPFIQMELSHPGVRTILNSYDVAGGQHTLVTAYASQKWRSDHPLLYQATFDALAEAMEIIKSDKRAAAELFARTEPSKLSTDDVYKILLNDKMMDYSATPHKIMVWEDFMAKAGRLKHPFTSSKDIFFETGHGAADDQAAHAAN
jgi:NitT/TauT family transport system substrate-binding protein